MTDDERKLLEMCRPEVTLQSAPKSHRVDVVENNPHFYVASGCVQNGWLEVVREQDFNQVVYRITKAGADVLAANS